MKSQGWMRAMAVYGLAAAVCVAVSSGIAAQQPSQEPMTESTLVERIQRMTKMGDDALVEINNLNQRLQAISVEITLTDNGENGAEETRSKILIAISDYEGTVSQIIMLTDPNHDLMRHIENTLTETKLLVKRLERCADQNQPECEEDLEFVKKEVDSLEGSKKGYLLVRGSLSDQLALLRRFRNRVTRRIRLDVLAQITNDLKENLGKVQEIAEQTKLLLEDTVRTPPTTTSE